VVLSKRRGKKGFTECPEGAASAICLIFGLDGLKVKMLQARRKNLDKRRGRATLKGHLAGGGGGESVGK